MKWKTENDFEDLFKIVVYLFCIHVCLLFLSYGGVVCAGVVVCVLLLC